MAPPEQSSSLLRRPELISLFLIIIVAVGVAGYLLGARTGSGSRAVKQGEAFHPFQQEAPAAIREEIIHLKAQLASNPHNANALSDLGDLYFNARKYNQAIDYYKRAIDIKPGDADLYNDLGLSVFYLGNALEGIKYIDEGIEKNPEFQRIWLTKGFILANGMNNFSGAREAWEKAVSIDPGSGIGKAAQDYITQFKDK